MNLKCLVFASLLAVIQAASVRQREIPVHVIYEEAGPGPDGLQQKHWMHQNAIQTVKERKFEEKRDVEGEATTKENIEEVTTEENEIYNSIRNLDAKVQLSPEEIKQNVKHLPVPSISQLEEEDVKTAAQPVQPLLEDVTSVQPESQPEEETKAQTDENITPQPTEKTPEIQSTHRPHYEFLALLEQAQEIAFFGIKLLRERYAEAQKLASEHISDENWNKLQENVEQLFTTEREKINQVVARQNTENQNQNQSQNPNQNFIQNIISGFQNVTNNFIQNLQQRPGGANGTQAEEQPGFGSGQLISNFVGGFQQVINNINNLASGNNPVNGGNEGNGTQSDTDASTQRPTFVSNLVSSFQQIFNNQVNRPQGGAQGNQSDTGTDNGGNNNQQQQGPGGFFQGALNQFGQAVNNIINNNRPGGAAGGSGSQDTPDTTTNRNPIQTFQNISSQIISNFNQFNPFSPSTKPPGTAGDETASTQRPTFVQNIGQAIQGFNPFRPQQQGGNNGNQTASNPIVVGIQNASNQFQEVISNQSFGNPIESIQNAISGGQNGNNPIQSIQNAFSNGTNPIESIQSAINGGQNGNNPIQTIQNAISNGNNGNNGGSTRKAIGIQHTDQTIEESSEKVEGRPAEKEQQQSSQEEKTEQTSEVMQAIE